MPELNETQLEMLQELVDQGVAPDLEKALDFCIYKSWSESQPEFEETPEVLAKLDEARAGIERGEFTRFENVEDMIAFLRQTTIKLSDEELAKVDEAAVSLEQGGGRRFDSIEEMREYFLSRIAARDYAETKA